MKRKPAAKPRIQTRLIDKKPAFLAAFIRCASLTHAAAEVGIDRCNHYDWLRDDPEYAKAFEAAKPQAGQTVKDALTEWAMVGIRDPVIYQGHFCYATRERKMVTLQTGEEVDEATHAEMQKRLGMDVPIVSSRVAQEEYGEPLYVLRRSEGLMARLAKAWLPEEFGDKLSAELTGKNGGAIEIGIVERLNAARARLAKTKGEKS